MAGAFLVLAGGVGPPSAWAGGVKFDGSLGSNATLSGPGFLIPAESGKHVGRNLFHSFSQFDLSNGESATFLAPLSGSAVDNILARITSGSASSIDGLVRSQISGANLLLINPQGFIFGPNAQLDVSGSFTATSASSVNFADGTRFSAQPGASDLSLSTAPISSFGFLAGPGEIKVNSSALLSSGDITLLGGNVSLNQAILASSAGKIALVSTQSQGTIAADYSGSSASGSIKMVRSRLDTSGVTGGKVVIRGGTLALDRSTIVSETQGAGVGAGVDIRVSGAASATLNSRILTLTNGAGKAGPVLLRSGSLAVSADSAIASQALANATQTAQAGDVLVEAGAVTVSNGGSISASTFGLGTGGLVEVKADRLRVAGSQDLQTTAGIFSNTNGTGAGGAGGGVRIRANSIELIRGGAISADTFGFGHGGNVDVAAMEIFIAAQGSAFKTGIFADSGGVPNKISPGGVGGSIHVSADSLRIVDGGLISTKSVGLGVGGDTQIDVDKLVIDKAGSKLITGVAVDAAAGPGRGGNLRINADEIEVLGGGRISANAGGTGPGGNVSVHANQILLRGSFNDPSAISAESSSTGKGGAGGTVEVVTSGLQIFEGARISAITFGSGLGGDILVVADKAEIKSTSQVPTGIFASTQSTTEAGRAGNIRVEIRDLGIRDGGSISASSVGPGPGGNVFVQSTRLTLNNGSTVEASASGAGPAGSVTIDVTKALTVQNGSAVSSTSLISTAGTVSLRSANDINLDQGSITVQASAGNAGQITLSAGHQLSMLKSNLLASAGLNGGNIFIQAPYVVLDHSLISANALGLGGNINLLAQYVFRSSTPITATGAQAGTVNIAAPDLALSNALLSLPEGVLDVSTQLREQCARRLGADFSSFLVLGRGGVESDPEEAPLLLGHWKPKDKAPPVTRTAE